jgi:hypothetical protein
MRSSPRTAPPVKWKMFTSVKTRPEEERAAELTDWPFRWGVAGLERESMRSVAVVMSWSSVGEGAVVGRPWWSRGLVGRGDVGVGWEMSVQGLLFWLDSV